MRVTPAERWELLARRESVESARLRLAIAEAQAQEAVNRIMTAYGVTGPCDIADDGTITAREVQPIPSAGGRSRNGGTETEAV